MPYYTPLRYPGGKRRLASIVMALLERNNLHDVQYVEPYAGGSAVAMALLFEEYASVVHINDLSRPVFAFWHTALNDTEWLCHRIEAATLTMTQWRRQRAIYEDSENADLATLGFAALFLNRTNRSGILGGGVVGGKDQSGPWGIDARFNREELVRRIRRIGRYRNRIRLYQRDALEFTTTVLPDIGPRPFVFFDPPYIEKGKDLYLDRYSVADHRTLAKNVAELKQPWIVTYDHAAIKHHLYPNHRRLVFGLRYSAHIRGDGKEVMFFANGLSVPESWHSCRKVCLTPPSCEYPLYGKMEAMKPHPEMIEGPEAEKRFMGALRTVLSVPKSAVPNPFRKPQPKRKKRPAKS